MSGSPFILYFELCGKTAALFALQALMNGEEQDEEWHQQDLPENLPPERALRQHVERRRARTRLASLPHGDGHLPASRMRQLHVRSLQKGAGCGRTRRLQLD